MIQALHAMLGSADDKTEISLLYGSRTSDDILGGASVDEWAKSSGGRFKCTHGMCIHTPTVFRCFSTSV
jgi:cytochrome-b5 reductase